MINSTVGNLGMSPVPTVICTSCGEAYTVQGGRACGRDDCPCDVRLGVLCTKATEASFGEAGPEEMRNVVASAREHGWREAIGRHFVGERAFVNDLVLDPRRIRFAELLDLSGDEDVLDIGCGYGGITLQLAPFVKSVTALDITLERIAFLEVARQQEKLDNIGTLCNGDILDLPFADNQFDVILLVGVFEYLPKSLPELTVADAHARALEEIVRVLKPGGQLYLGTKNRYAWQYLAGARDHNNLPFGPVLPLGLADWWCKRRNGQPYRIVSYSARGYRRLLQRAGLGDIQVCWPIGGYQSPDTIVPLDDRAALLEAIKEQFPKSLKRKVVSAMTRLNVMPHVVTNFSIVATKAPN